MSENTPSPLTNVITIDDDRIKNHLDRVVRGSAEETLNALLDAEADRLCNAQRYERSEAGCDTRAGHYERNLTASLGSAGVGIGDLSKVARSRPDRSRKTTTSIADNARSAWRIFALHRDSPGRCGNCGGGGDDGPTPATAS
jgi:Transposase, Mutator family